MKLVNSATFFFERLSFILLCFVSVGGFAQTLGGKATYNFLSLPSSPLLTAAGGVNISYGANDVSVTSNNPALLNPSLNKQLSLSFQSSPAGTKACNTTGAYHSEKLGTTFGAHINYYNYGSVPNTDAAGNIAGTFHPVDYVVQVSAARNYLEKWTYGATLKFINSQYGQYTSSALAADIGLLYHDTVNRISVALLAKNMGSQLKTYAGEGEELPFDLQIGITKRLAKAPFGFSLTAQHLQTFNISYNDTLFNRENDFASSNSFIQKLATHFVLATHIYVGAFIEATIGYNVLRRQELRIGNEENGLTGFSAGLHVRMKNLQVSYAHAAYQQGIATDQIGITAALDRLFGLGD